MQDWLTYQQSISSKQMNHHEILIPRLYFELRKDPDAIGEFERLVQHVLSLNIPLGNRKDVVVPQLLRNSVWK